MIFTIRIPGNIDRVIASSKIKLDKKKKVDSILPISAIDVKFSYNGKEYSNSQQKLFDEYFKKELEKLKKR